MHTIMLLVNVMNVGVYNISMLKFICVSTTCFVLQYMVLNSGVQNIVISMGVLTSVEACFDG
jgi:hypothetical protein